MTVTKFNHPSLCPALIWSIDISAHCDKCGGRVELGTEKTDGTVRAVCQGCKQNTQVNVKDIGEAKKIILQHAIDIA
jgi:hypothetical protein